MVEERRAESQTHLFTYGEPITRMMKSAWKRARLRAGLPQVRAHAEPRRDHRIVSGNAASGRALCGDPTPAHQGAAYDPCWGVPVEHFDRLSWWPTKAHVQIVALQHRERAQAARRFDDRCHARSLPTRPWLATVNGGSEPDGRTFRSIAIVPRSTPLDCPR